MNTTTDLPRIPLAKLHLSPLNARKTRSGNVDDLAASIAAHGLLQNLTVTVNDNPGEFEVVAGGRRLAAIQQLDREGRLPDALQAGVPCLVIENNDVAHEASTAENTLREDMHPADEFEAFGRMVDAGKPIAEIAAHFGVEETRVKQRLKLARVAPDLFELYREGALELSQLQALTVTDDHEAQRRAVEDLGGAEFAPAYAIRKALIGRKAVRTDSSLAEFVGLDAYEAAGGTVKRDLFGEEAWCEDTALLDQLALDKLEAKAQQLRNAGWSWVEPRLTLEHVELNEFPQLPADGVEEYLPPEAKVRGEAIEARLEEIDGVDADAIEMDEYNRLTEEQNALEDELAMLSEQIEERWPQEAMAKGGVLVTIWDGAIHAHYGRLKPGEKIDKAGKISGEAKPNAAPKKTGQAQKPVLSAAILTTLGAHRSARMQAILAVHPQLALSLLLDRLIASHRATHGGVSNCVGIGHVPSGGLATPPDTAISKKLTEARKLATDSAMAKVPRKSAEILPWLFKQPVADLLAILAVLVADRFHAVTERGVHEIHAQLDALIDTPNIAPMADHWTPTTDNFLGRIHADLVAEAVAEARGKDAAAKLATLKRDALIAEAGKLLAGTGWLPKPLRGPGYALKTTAPAKPAVAKKPAKKTAAKAKPAAKPKAKKPAKKPAAKKAKAGKS